MKAIFATFFLASFLCHGAAGNLHPTVGKWRTLTLLAGGNYTSTSVLANDVFMKIVQSRNLQNTLYRVNTYTGLNLNGCKAPLINTYGSTTDAMQNFVAGDYSESSGLKGDGTSKYVNTGLVMTTLPSVNSGTMFVYIRTNNQETALTMGTGAGDAGGNVGYLYIRDVGNLLKGVWFKETGASTTGTDSSGLWMISRTATNVITLYRNGASVASGSGDAGAFTATFPMFVHAWNNVTFSAQNWTARPLGGYGITSGYSATQASDFYYAWQRKETILGRQL